MTKKSTSVRLVAFGVSSLSPDLLSVYLVPEGWTRLGVCPLRLLQGTKASGWRRARGVAATLGGAVMAISGVYLIGIYIYGVVQVMHEPDKSLIFWGLAILFMGIMCTAAGCTLFVHGRNALRARSLPVS